MMKTYQHLFFDLDHTLWDFEANSTETLTSLFDEYKLEEMGIPSSSQFINRYKFHNDLLWDQYRSGEIDVEMLRRARFIYVLADYKIINDHMALEISQRYTDECPAKSNLMPFAFNILNYLRENYKLHIITNGVEQVQLRKLRCSKLHDYFDVIATPDNAGVLKPNKAIFDYSLLQAGADPLESIYIGDNLDVDIKGAREAGMDQVYYNPGSISHREEITYEISCLSELEKIF